MTDKEILLENVFVGAALQQRGVLIREETRFFQEEGTVPESVFAVAVLQRRRVSTHEETRYLSRGGNCA